MPIGFPAYHTDRFVVQIPPEEFGMMVRAAFAHLGWSPAGEYGNVLCASTGFQMFSWGERISVEMLADGSLLVTSRYVMPTQWIDLGHNMGNVYRLMEQFKRLYANRQAAVDAANRTMAAPMASGTFDL